MASVLVTLQQEIAARLAADPFFSGGSTPGVVLYEQSKDLATQVARTQAEIGWGVLVLTPDASTSLQNIPGTFFDNISVTVLCFTDAYNYPDAPRALESAEYALNLLTWWIPSTTGQPLAPAKPTLVPAQPDNPNAEAWEVHFTSSGGTQSVPPAVGTVTITNSGGRISMSCSNAGAAIFYTVNGKYPAPRVGTLYTGSFATPASGTRIRAYAWLAGYSQPAESTLTIP